MEENDIILKKRELELILNKYFKKYNITDECNEYSYADVQINEKNDNKRCYFKIYNAQVNHSDDANTCENVMKFGYLDMLTGEYVVNSNKEKNLYDLIQNVVRFKAIPINTFKLIRTKCKKCEKYMYNGKVEMCKVITEDRNRRIHIKLYSPRYTIGMIIDELKEKPNFKENVEKLRKEEFRKFDAVTIGEPYHNYISKDSYDYFREFLGLQ